MRTMQPREAEALIEVTRRGDVPDVAGDYAVDKVAAVLRLAHEQVTGARVKLVRTRHGDPDSSWIVQVNLELRRQRVRVQVAGRTWTEAVDRAQDRLRRKLSQLGRHPARQGGRQRPHRPGFDPLALSLREVVRHKAFTPRLSTVEEAELDMELGDYDFWMFTEAGSGVDCLLYRGGLDGYRLASTAPITGQWAGVSRDVWPLPVLGLNTAVSVLDACDAPFVFYVDAGTGRGQLLYRRHDGNYALVTPAG